MGCVYSGSTATSTIRPQLPPFSRSYHVGALRISSVLSRLRGVWERFVCSQQYGVLIAFGSSQACPTPFPERQGWLTAGASGGGSISPVRAPYDPVRLDRPWGASVSVFVVDDFRPTMLSQVLGELCLLRNEPLGSVKFHGTPFPSSRSTQEHLWHITLAGCCCCAFSNRP